MTITNGYCTLAEFKARVDITSTDTTRDAYIEQIIESASRWIDQYTGRFFYRLTATRTYTAESASTVRVPDLISVSTLKTDEDGDRTYETTWSATDYDLMPYNDAPYQWLETTPNGLYSFPSLRRGVQIAGSWGWPGSSTTSSATLGEDLDTSETGVDVSSGLAFAIGNTIRIGSEDMFVDSIASNTLTVRRGQNGTTAATHSSGAAITVLTPVYPVREACSLLSARLYKRKDAVLGVAGNTSMGQLVMAIPADRDVENLLAAYKRVTL